MDTTTAMTPDAGTGLVERQLEALRRQLRYLAGSGEWWRERLAGVEIDGIRDLADLATIPLFDKGQHRRSQEDSLARHGHPYGMHVAAPVEDIRYINATSGTSGAPTFYTFTADDARQNDEVLGRAFAAIGLRPGDTVLHAYALSMFVGGTPWLRALDAAGIRVLPIGAEGGSARLLTVARLVRPRALFCTPSLAEHLIERAPDILGAGVDSLGIEIIQCGGEPGAGDPAVRARISEAYGAAVFDGMGGCWGHFMISCEFGTGMHPVAPEYHLIELVDAAGVPLPQEHGIVGQLTNTALKWQAGPILRYNMGDNIQVLTDECPCGRSGPRYRILGRADDMLIVNGVNVHPSAVKEVVAGFVPRTTGAVRVVAPGDGPKVAPPLRIKVESALEPGSHDAEVLVGELSARIRDLLRFRPNIELVPPESLGRSLHKTSLLERIP